MRLLSIASASYRGGATFSLLNTLKGLKDKGVDILVVTPENGFLCEELEKYDIEYRKVSVVFSVWPPARNLTDLIKYILRGLLCIYKYFKGYFKLKRIIREWRPDIIHTNVSVIDVGYRLSRKFNIPHIWHIREYGDLDFDLHLSHLSKDIENGLINHTLLQSRIV